MSRIPVFELHIRPMFRMIDLDHMLQRELDLADYDVVKDQADEILEHIRSSSPMPTAATGGPWPEEWIALFVRWTEHFHKLDVNDGRNYSLNKAFGKFQLSGDTSLPHFGAKTWFDLRGIRDGNRVYWLVLERALPAPPDLETDVTIREFFEADEDPNGVWVIDKSSETFVEFQTSHST